MYVCMYWYLYLDICTTSSVMPMYVHANVCVCISMDIDRVRMAQDIHPACVHDIHNTCAIRASQHIRKAYNTKA